MTANELAIADARKRADKIRGALTMLIDFRDCVLEEIEKARTAEDHVALGYKSWTAYVADEFGSLLAELDREDRRNVSAILSDSGMSVRAIATVTGVSKSTVERDLSQVSHRGTPDDDVPVEDPPNIEFPEPRNVIGLDGKTYSQPVREKKKPKRQALNIELMQANYELQKAIRKMDRATTDARFDRLAPMDREKAKNEFSRLQKQMFEIRARFGGGAR